MTEKSPRIPPSTLQGSPLRVVEENLEDHINSTVPPDQGLIRKSCGWSDLSQDWRGVQNARIPSWPNEFGFLLGIPKPKKIESRHPGGDCYILCGGG